MLKLLSLCALLLLSSCETQTADKQFYTPIQARDTGNSSERPFLYRIALPSNWETKADHKSVQDTMLPIAEFVYHDNHGDIRLTVHNFPYVSQDQRIPPEAQLARWKKQLDPLNEQLTTRQAFAGFVGLHLWAEGYLQNTLSAMSAWSMQLAPELDRELMHTKGFDPQTRSDITIKATGPLRLMEEKQEEIASIARSFELITPLPNP